MINATIKLNKRTLLTFGLILVILSLLALELFINTKEKSDVFLNTVEERIGYIYSLGYKPSEKSENESQVFIPKEFPQVLEDYNKKQQEIGFDLHYYEGKTLKRYTYICEENVTVTLFVYDNILAGREVKNN